MASLRSRSSSDKKMRAGPTWLRQFKEFSEKPVQTAIDQNGPRGIQSRRTIPTLIWDNETDALHTYRYWAALE